MAGKISKKDQDPNQVDHDRDALAEMSKRKCQHFAIGTFIVYDGQRWEVVGRLGDTLTIKNPDEPYQFIKPFGLRSDGL